MWRVADGYGIAILSGCCAAYLALLVRAVVTARRDNAKLRLYSLYLLLSFVGILAVWLGSTGNGESLLITVACLLPVLTAAVNLLRLVLTLFHRDFVASLLRLAAPTVIAAVGAVGSWMLAMPGPFLNQNSMSFGMQRKTTWSTDRLNLVFNQARDLGSLGVMVIHDGALVVEWGETDRVTDSHSIRKSILSALIGIAVDKGMMDIHLTLAQLGIDDINPPLTAQEQQATVEHMLASRSGIYHSYIGDEEGQRPVRGSHPPGTHFFYNNWSFNALGAIFERETGLSIGEALKTWIADPIGMQDFRVEDVIYSHFPQSDASQYPAYRIRISTRDLARFGLLFLHNGEWQGKQIISAQWIDKSTSAFARGDRYGYGYSWWRSLGYPAWASDRMYFGTGTGGQKLLIDPQLKIVAVHRTDTANGLARGLWNSIGAKVNNEQFLALIKAILAACPDAERCPL